MVAELLDQMGYSLQANRKTKEGGLHPDRDAQFEYIHQKVKQFQSQDQPVIPVDAKKKELVGNFKNQGREWQPKGVPEEVLVYDFESLGSGKITPYGVYDLSQNKGWVSVGVDKDTVTFRPGPVNGTKSNTACFPLSVRIDGVNHSLAMR